MDRLEIIKKAMIKLGMIGDPSDPVNDIKKNNLKKILWNQKEPKNVYSIINTFIEEQKLSKEAKQDLFKFFKFEGLIKHSLTFGTEKAWQQLKKDHGLQGFLLQS